jgi:ribosome maturation factor RimP
LKSNRIEELVAEVVGAHGLDLYDVQLGSTRGRSVLRVFVDRPGPREPGVGVTVGDCERVSRELSQIFDSEDPIASAYVLEVSSPGVERQLTAARHWRQAIGERVAVNLDREVEGLTSFEAIVESVEAQSVKLRLAPPEKNWKKGQRRRVIPMEDWALLEVLLSDVRKARTVYEFG